MRLLGQLARDHVQDEDQLVARADQTVRARAARLLLGLAGAGPSGGRAAACGEISMAREEMAMLVGTTRETLSRALNEFAKRGAVALRDGTIIVLVAAILEQIAG